MARATIEPASTPAGVLRGASAVLALNGRYIGSYCDTAMWRAGLPPQRCPVCLIGAMNIAAGLEPDNCWPGNARDPRVDIARRAAEIFVTHVGIGRSDIGLVGDLADWHDGQGDWPQPTDEQVQAALLSAADHADRLDAQSD
ncbi:hypothetical protein [Spongiactinospora sp. TRM90649]|uniref:DUF6197 family protein n=1 Tax=Spongiactinospora sp. TRM90649 TaxID=3031114 RepID=UPI0023F746C8|nr:hypothetical protein [Spongiactinospora sp. TRM90649]MDF5756552.1 hypothetical protein [Spongiactinospora sp. TRM90649]